MRDAYENGIDTLEEYRRNKERLQKERLQLEERLKKASAPCPGDAASLRAQPITACQFLTCPDLSDPKGPDHEARGNALRRIIKKIIYLRDRQEFHVYYYL